MQGVGEVNGWGSGGGLTGGWCVVDMGERAPQRAMSDA